MAKAQNRIETEGYQGSETPCPQKLREVLQGALHERFPAHFMRDCNILPHYSQGVSNITYVVQDRLQRLWIVRARYGEGLRFLKEKWILNNYSDEFPSATPYPEGFHTITFEDRPLSFFVQSYVGYPSAYHLKNHEFSQAILSEVACTARLINDCVAIGYGTRFIPGQNTFADLTWKQHVETSLEEMQLDELARMGQIPLSHIKAFEKRYFELSSLDPTPRLYHNDLLKNWGNILVNKRNNIQAVIDWEHAGSGIGIPEEIATALYVMHRDELPAEQKKIELRQILLGYDITFRDYLANYHEQVDLFLTRIAIQKIWYYKQMTQGRKTLPEWRKNFFRQASRLVEVKCKIFAS